MRPSDARALRKAELVFWIGPDFTPWLAKPLRTLAAQAEVMALHGIEGTVHRPFREGARFEAHGHDDGHHEADGAHDDHHDADDDHHDAHGGHDHGAIDPHSWLDPRNAALWADAVAARLAAADPVNAALYTENAAAFRDDLSALEKEVAAALEPLHGAGFIVFHDAYQYFEARFGIEAAGAIALGDASTPGAARLRAVRETVRDTGAACIFLEEQQPEKLAHTVAEGLSVKIGKLDPIGATIPPGPTLYATLLRDLAESFNICLGAR